MIVSKNSISNFMMETIQQKKVDEAKMKLKEFMKALDQKVKNKKLVNN